MRLILRLGIVLLPMLVAVLLANTPFATGTGTNTLTTVDSADDVGNYTSIAVGTDANPVVGYHDVTTDDLNVAHCGDASCSAGNTLTTVDSAGLVGEYTAIAIGTDGMPVVSYYDRTNTDLKVAHCGDASCSAGNTLTTVDSGVNVGRYTAIAIGTDGKPVVSYVDNANGDLRVAHCGDASCSAGNTLTTVDSASFVDEYTAIAIGTDGMPVVSYYDFGNEDLKVAHCGDASCSAGNTLTTVDSAGLVGKYLAIAIGTDGKPVVSYYDRTNTDLKVAHCGDASCSADNTLTTVDSGDSSAGQYTAIAIGTDGKPVVSYLDGTNLDLKVAHCGDASCSAGNTLTTVDSAGSVGKSTAIAIGTDGKPVVSYTDETNGDLKVAHCGDQSCDTDSDDDGCADSRELQPKANASTGGGRNPKYFWDFYDVWTRPAGNPTGWERNKVINISDILGVAARFGSGTVMSKQDALAAALVPPTDNTSYHPAYDRGMILGPNVWNVAPPDGAINITSDILGAARQFGHSCN